MNDYITHNDIEAARQELQNAITAFICYKSTVVDITSSNGVGVDQEALISTLKKFEDSLQELNRSHTTWVCKSEFSDEQLAAERYSLKWLENEWDQFFVLENKLDVLLSSFTMSPTVITNKQKLLQYDNEMKIMQSDIKTNIFKLNELVSTIPVPEDEFIQLLSWTKDILKGSGFRELMEKILLYDQINLQERLENLEQFRREQMSNIFCVELTK